MRISPKMREKPAARMNSTPPSARLFRLWISHRVMDCSAVEEAEGADYRRTAALLLDVLGRRIVARIHRAGQEFLLVVVPELADRGIGLDHRVDQLAILALHL